MALTGEQRERYARNIELKEIGPEGQEKLLAAKVLVIGAGGLGSPAALYLAAAGVGTVGIADPDTVELSNLQRQVLHGTKDLGRPKVASAEDRLLALDPALRVRLYPAGVTAENIGEIIADYDFILDCTDNFPTKYLINDACVRMGKPFCHAGILRFGGQLLTYVPGQGPCYRCVFGAPPEPDTAAACRAAGVVGAAAGAVGCMQAMEAVKYITGAGELLTGRLLMYDGLHQEFQTLRLPVFKKCPVCSARADSAGEPVQ